MHSAELQISALGVRGDGVAHTEAGTQHVAFALPGERVAADSAAPDGLPRLLSAPSPERRQPVCRHFGICGGCSAQHMSERLYAEWKRDGVVAALGRRGLAPPVAPLHRIPPRSRRRAVLTARRAGVGIVLGYHRRRSHDLVGIEECPVLVAAIVDGLPALREVAALLGAPEVRLTVLATPVGLDVAAETGGKRPDAAAVAELGSVAARHGLARIAVEGEPLIECAKPVLDMDGVGVAVPPGAFVQAVRQSEAAMRALVVAALGNATLAADLFCGVGTITLALARRARVGAFDSDPAAIAALSAAARHTQRLRPIEASVRDLFREPLSAGELQAYDTVVFDPPRAGALRQAQELARSNVGRVIAVSCDPGTLARDAQILTHGGYRVVSVTPIDQFVFSAHVETVAVLEKSGVRAGRNRRQRRSAGRN